MQKEVKLLSKSQDKQRADNNQNPMKYQQFVPGFPIRSPVSPGQGQQRPGQRPSESQGPGQGQRPPGFQGPGQGQRPPGFQGPGQGQRPPGFQGPGRPGGQPPSAPPSFTPQLPRESDQELLSDPSGFRGPSGGAFIGFRGRFRDFRGCMNRFTYIWLTNGNSFWFYPVFASRNTLEGFRWRRNRWEYERININRILFHLCF